MPFQPASTLEKTVRVKALLLGSAGIGKTTVAVCTVPRPVGVLLCESDSSLDYARVAMREDDGMSDKEIDKALSFQRIDTYEQMLKAVQEARAAAEAGDIKSLVVDPFNFWADRLTDQAFKWTQTKEGNDDGRRAHPEATKRARQIIYQLLALPCHTVVVSHYMDVGDAAKRGGPDKVPMLPNKEMRAVVHGMFPHKLWMQMNEKAERVFVTTPQGATGPGVRGYRGASEIPADFSVLMRALSIPGALTGDDDEDEDEEPAKPAPRGATNGANGAHKTTSAPAPARAARPPVATNNRPTTPTQAKPTPRPSPAPQRR